MSSIDELLTNSPFVFHEPLMYDGLRQVYLQGGHIHVSIEKCLITTIVASSVAVALWDADLGIGGMNHFMLPAEVGRDAKAATPRYATPAMSGLLRQMLDAGARLDSLRAKIFGGACVIDGPLDSDAFHDLGRRNAEAARARLTAEGIPIVEEQLGGAHGRKVTFRSENGWSVVKEVSR